MPGFQRVRQNSGRAGRIAVLALGAVVAGCSTAPVSAPSSNSSFTDRFTSLFATSPSGQQQVKVTGPDPDLDCPTIDVRQGAATLQMTATGKGPAAGTLRYQVSVSRTARECAVAGGTMSVKVGIQGRIILGPAGAPGQIEVPLRLAVIREGVEPKTIWTKFVKVPVALPAGQSSIPFAYVEENLSFAVPALAGELDAYVIYVGFDQNMKDPPVKKPKGRKS
jgi:hypothetical protein